MGFSKLACASIAVDSIDDVLPAFTEGLGLDVLGPVQTSPRGYSLRWLELGTEDGLMLELMEPTSLQSPVHRFLTGPGRSRIYQIRLHTSDLDSSLRGAESAGLRVVHGPDVPGHPPIGWIHPSSTGGALIEIMQT